MEVETDEVMEAGGGPIPMTVSALDQVKAEIFGDETVKDLDSPKALTYATWMLLKSLDAAEAVKERLQVLLFPEGIPERESDSCTEGHAVRELFIRSLSFRRLLAILRWLRWLDVLIYRRNLVVPEELQKRPMYSESMAKLRDDGGMEETSYAWFHPDWPLHHRNLMSERDKTKEDLFFLEISRLVRRGEWKRAFERCAQEQMQWVFALIGSTVPFTCVLSDPCAVAPSTKDWQSIVENQYGLEEEFPTELIHRGDLLESPLFCPMAFEVRGGGERGGPRVMLPPNEFRQAGNRNREVVADACHHICTQDKGDGDGARLPAGLREMSKEERGLYGLVGGHKAAVASAASKWRERDRVAVSESFAEEKGQFRKWSDNIFAALNTMKVHMTDVLISKARLQQKRQGRAPSGEAVARFKGEPWEAHPPDLSGSAHGERAHLLFKSRESLLRRPGWPGLSSGGVAFQEGFAQMGGEGGGGDPQETGGGFFGLFDEEASVNVMGLCKEVNYEFRIATADREEEGIGGGEVDVDPPWKLFAGMWTEVIHSCLLHPEMSVVWGSVVRHTDGWLQRRLKAGGCSVFGAPLVMLSRHLCRLLEDEREVPRALPENEDVRAVGWIHQSVNLLSWILAKTDTDWADEREVKETEQSLIRELTQKSRGIADKIQEEILAARLLALLTDCGLYLETIVIRGWAGGDEGMSDREAEEEIETRRGLKDREVAVAAFLFELLKDDESAKRLGGVLSSAVDAAISAFMEAAEGHAREGSGMWVRPVERPGLPQEGEGGGWGAYGEGSLSLFRQLARRQFYDRVEKPNELSSGKRALFLLDGVLSVIVVVAEGMKLLEVNDAHDAYNFGCSVRALALSVVAPERREHLFRVAQANLIRNQAEHTGTSAVSLTFQAFLCSLATPLVFLRLRLCDLFEAATGTPVLLPFLRRRAEDPVLQSALSSDPSPTTEADTIVTGISELQPDHAWLLRKAMSDSHISVLNSLVADLADSTDELIGARKRELEEALQNLREESSLEMEAEPDGEDFIEDNRASEKKEREENIKGAQASLLDLNEYTRKLERQFEEMGARIPSADQEREGLLLGSLGLEKPLLEHLREVLSKKERDIGGEASVDILRSEDPSLYFVDVLQNATASGEGTVELPSDAPRGLEGAVALVEMRNLVVTAQGAAMKAATARGGVEASYAYALSQVIRFACTRLRATSDSVFLHNERPFFPKDASELLLSPLVGAPGVPRCAVSFEFFSKEALPASLTSLSKRAVLSAQLSAVMQRRLIEALQAASIPSTLLRDPQIAATVDEAQVHLYEGVSVGAANRGAVGSLMGGTHAAEVLEAMGAWRQLRALRVAQMGPVQPRDVGPQGGAAAAAAAAVTGNLMGDDDEDME